MCELVTGTQTWMRTCQHSEEAVNSDNILRLKVVKNTSFQVFKKKLFCRAANLPIEKQVNDRRLPAPYNKTDD